MTNPELQGRNGTARTTTARNGTARKSTARRQFAAAQPRPSSRYFELSPDLACTSSFDGYFRDLTPAWERLLGWSDTELRARPLLTFIHPDDRERMQELRAALLGGDHQSNVVCRLLAKDGGWRWLEWNSIAVAEEQLVYSSGRDITERNQIDSELGEVVIRALDASRLKSQFVANMSHELRTPLNCVLGASELLLDTELDAAQREYVDVLQVSGDALIGLIEDILDVSKIEAGTLELESKPFEIRGLVEDVCAMVAGGLRPETVELMSWIDPALPANVLGDAKRVRQVLANLTNNAVRSTAAGEVVIRVGGSTDRDDVVHLRIEVVASGIGIAATASESIFESFASDDSPTAGPHRGPDLGLAIANELVGVMGGEIGVDSTLGEGSTFWFTLPTRCARPLKAAPERDELRGIHALVVEDNAMNRAILEGQIDGWGMTYQSAPDADAALALLRAPAQHGRRYEVVLIDSVMPGMSGAELVRAIRADPALASLRTVVMATARDRQALAVGGEVDALVSKPIRQSRLYEALASGVGARSATPQPGAPPATGAGEASNGASGHRVLVVEDNPVNQLVALRLLQKRGFAVDVAANGREALEMHARAPYAAIFMDCQMPELDGYDATREIRRREGDRRHTPIIALTANTLPQDSERCLAAGMDFYSGKPVHPDGLDYVIARALGADGADDLPEPAHPPSPLTGHASARAEAWPLFDRSLLAEVCQGDEGVRAGLIATFLEQSQADVAELAIAIAVGDTDTVEHAAHRLKGGAACVGALRLATISDEICRLARAGRLEKIAGPQIELDQAFRLTQAAMDLDHAAAEVREQPHGRHPSAVLPSA
jgi:PAS domain S-box-containing protein